MPPHGATQTGDPPEAQFLQFTHRTIDYLSDTAKLFANTVDMQDEASVAHFVAKLADLPAVQALLPLFAKGSTFTAIFRMCNTLAAAASGQKPQSTEPHVSENITPSPEDAPYLRAARSPPRPVSRLPTLGRPNSATPPVATTRITRDLSSRLRRTSRMLCGYDRTSYVKVQSARPLADPARFRQALSLGGFPTACAIIPTTDPRVIFVCAAESALPHTLPAYTAFRDFGTKGGDTAPSITVSNTLNLPNALPNPEHIRSILPSLRTEIHRLESQNCTWRARSYFAAHLRNTETELYARLMRTDPHAQETPMVPPPSPSPDSIAGKRPRPDTDLDSAVPMAQ